MSEWSSTEVLVKLYCLRNLIQKFDLNYRKRYRVQAQREEDPVHAKNQSDCRIRFRALLGKNQVQCSIFPQLTSLYYYYDFLLIISHRM